MALHAYAARGGHALFAAVRHNHEPSEKRDLRQIRAHHAGRRALCGVGVQLANNPSFVTIRGHRVLSRGNLKVKTTSSMASIVKLV